MNQVDELKRQIKDHELQIELLRRQLENIQTQCEHRFTVTPLIKICEKCDYMSAEYY